ncbi:hypothetical protein Tco_0347735 [Tanacetum coccineum]
MNPVIQDILILELMLSSGEGVFIERGKSRVASRLTDFSESEEDLSSDHPEHEGAALDRGITQGLKSSIQILSFFVISPLVSLIPLGVPFPFASNSLTYPEKLSAYECGFDPFIEQCRGNVDLSEVVILDPWEPSQEEMFLVDAGLATARMSMQDEPKGVPINRATGFENKVKNVIGEHDLSCDDGPAEYSVSEDESDSRMSHCKLRMNAGDGGVSGVSLSVVSSFDDKNVCQLSNQETTGYNLGRLVVS